MRIPSSIQANLILGCILASKASGESNFGELLVRELDGAHSQIKWDDPMGNQKMILARQVFETVFSS